MYNMHLPTRFTDITDGWGLPTVAWPVVYLRFINVSDKTYANTCTYVKYDI